jgi:hypothetical protein
LWIRINGKGDKWREEGAQDGNIIYPSNMKGGKIVRDAAGIKSFVSEKKP